MAASDSAAREYLTPRSRMDLRRARLAGIDAEIAGAAPQAMSPGTRSPASWVYLRWPTPAGGLPGPSPAHDPVPVALATA